MAYLEKYLYKFSTFKYNYANMKIKKALFFKPGAIGDLLHSLPVLRAFRQKFPTTHITIVVSPGMESVIQGPPVADCVLVFDKAIFKKSYLKMIKYGLKLRREQYDLFVDLQPSMRSRFVRTLAGAPVTLVYKKQKIIGADKRRLHAAENFMETLRPLGVADPVLEIDLPLSDDARQSAEVFLSQQGYDGRRTLIALNCSVGSARPARNWFPDRFSLLADRLIRELDASVVFIGGKEDRELVSGVMAAMHEKAITAAGKLTIAESAALLARCACLVSSDTGPLHLATAVHTPVIGLYGSTDPDRTGPLGAGNRVLTKKLPCVPCEEKKCPKASRACMDAITVEEVFEAVRKAVA
jgi:lipopolysaccharide heptosyltransferase II